MTAAPHDTGSSRRGLQEGERRRCKPHPILLPVAMVFSGAVSGCNVYFRERRRPAGSGRRRRFDHVSDRRRRRLDDVTERTQDPR